jgi:hypothetical protein
MREPPPDLPDLLAPRDRPRPVWVRIACLAGALVFFVIGIAGWLVPVVTGLPFYLAALVLLGVASDRVLGGINRLERKLPYRWRVGLRQALGKIPGRHMRRHVRRPDEGKGR